MRVLHVDPDPGWRGGQVQLALLLEGARHAGSLVGPADGALGRRLRDTEVPVWPAPPGRNPGALAAIWRAVHQSRPQVLAAHSSHAHDLAWPIARAAGLPLVVHRRLDFAVHARFRPKWRAVTRVLAVSEAAREALVRGGVLANQIAVVPDGVREQRGRAVDLGLAPGISLVLAVGALVPHKGHADVIDALVGLPRWVHVAIAGDGPLKPHLAAQARALGIGDRVHLLGHRADVPDLLASAQVFCHPSREEGLGQAVIEALVAGLPVVATDAGGLADLPIEAGFRARAGDPASLAAALWRAVRAPTSRADHRAIAAQWSADALVARTEAEYERALAAWGAR